jgi:hypothetical protein
MRRVSTCAVLVLVLGACQSAADAWTKLRGDAPPPAESTPSPSAAEPAKAASSPPVEAPAKAQASPAAPAKRWATPAQDAAAFEGAATRVTAEGLRKHVEGLASDDMHGRPTPSPELDRAAEIIAKEYARLALEMPSSAPEYRQRFDCSATGAGESSNVVAVLPGRDLASEVVVVSAHYDHIGTTDSGDDTIFNGANDNASGVAAMLAIAEVVSALPNKPRRSVLFVAFCGEEVGLRGSSYFAENPLVPLANIVADVNLEMLGRPGATTPKRAWITGAPFSDFAEAAVTVGAELGVEFVDGAVVGPTEGSVFERSDNWPLARAGVVAHSISAGALDHYYHHVDDEPALLEYERMVPIVQALARLTWRLAEADAKPKWSERGRAIGLGR